MSYQYAYPFYTHTQTSLSKQYTSRTSQPHMGAKHTLINTPTDSKCNKQNSCMKEKHFGELDVNTQLSTFYHLHKRTCARSTTSCTTVRGKKKLNSRSSAGIQNGLMLDLLNCQGVHSHADLQ